LLQNIDEELQKVAIATLIGSLCNRSFAPLQKDIAEMKNLLRKGYDAIIQTLNQIECWEIVPLYQSTVYDASCTYNIYAVKWMFASSLIMATAGLLMLTFRSSLLDTQYSYNHDTSSGTSSNQQDALNHETGEDNPKRESSNKKDVHNDEVGNCNPNGELSNQQDVRNDEAGNDNPNVESSNQEDILNGETRNKE
jgi:hypothetical protein